MVVAMFSMGLTCMVYSWWEVITRPSLVYLIAINVAVGIPGNALCESSHTKLSFELGLIAISLADVVLSEVTMVFANTSVEAAGIGK